MKLEFDIIKPNLYVAGNAVYFSMDPSDIIPVSRSVDAIIRKHIGNLKVKELDMEVLESGRSKSNEDKDTIPLKKYLDSLGEKEKHRIGLYRGITNPSANLFGLSYIIQSQTTGNSRNLSLWRKLQEDLADSNETFDRYDKKYSVYRLDREKTLKEMKRLHEELSPKIPDNYAEFVVIDGHAASGEQEVETKNLGVITLSQFKAKDKTNIEKAKSELVEKLKDTDGPCLSLDAPDIYRQMMCLYSDAPELIQTYGDVLHSSIWKKRLFRLDP